MGFHWQWFGVKKTGAGVVGEVLKTMSYEPRETKANLTLREFGEMERVYEPKGVVGACEYGGWTFFTGPYLFEWTDVAKVAVATGVDACFAAAESTVGSLEFRYAKKDGTLRVRKHYEELPPEPPGEKPKFLMVKQAKGSISRTATLYERKPKRWGRGDKLVARPLSGTELEEFVEARKGVVKDESEGVPLPGEPTEVRIDDHEPLVRVLAAIGCPVGEMMSHYGGTYDWTRMREVPGPGENDGAFTAYIRGQRKRT